MQEEWVAEATHPHRIAAVLPLRQSRLVMMLGAREYQLRQFAEAELRSQGDDAARALCWGRRATDPEIKDRAERLWDALFVCPDCHGEGDVEHRNRPEDEPYYTGCERCKKSGDLRVDLAYDYDESDWKPQFRRLDKGLEWEPAKN